MMNKTLGELPKKKTIYVFCRGRYCAMATDAVRILRKSGFEAYSLRESSYSISSHQKKADEVKA
jgi:rhodanese-related sulfurtransferase